MYLPITRDDYIIVGRSFSTDAILREVMRLVPTASEDMGTIASRGYTLRQLQELKDYRVRLQSESEVDRKRRTENKKAWQPEFATVRAAVLALRSGAAMALCAVESRRAPDGEDVDATREAVRDLYDQIEMLGSANPDPARIRVRLANLRRLLTLPELAPTASDARSRADVVEKLSMLGRHLPAMSALRQRVREESALGFDAADEADGRAYVNLQLLCRVGRDSLNEVGELDRAALYQLNDLHRSLEY